MPVQVDVITPLPEGWGMCRTCEAFIAQANLAAAPHERGLDSFPPEWQEEYIRLSDLILATAQKFGDAVIIRMFDPRSIQGMAKSIRYGIRKYPTFLVGNHEKMVGLDSQALNRAILAAQTQDAKE